MRLLCEFRAPARLDERLRVNTYVKRLGNKSLTLCFNIEKEGGVRTADCEIVLVCVNRTTFKSQPLPAELRAAFEPFVLS